MMAVGINLDQHSISAVRVDGTAKNPVITQFAAEPMPPQVAELETDPFTFQATILDDFLRRHKFPRENVFLSISSEYCIIRQFTVPFQSDDQIRKTIRFQAEAHIHSVNIDDLELTYKKVGERKSSSDVIVNAVRKHSLRETINALRRVHIDPVGIDTPVFAAVNSILNREEAAHTTATLWIDIGVHHTTMILTQGSDEKGLTPLKAVRLPKIGVNLPRDPAIEAHIAQVMRKHHIAATGETNVPTPTPGASGDWPGARDVRYIAGDQGPFDLPEFLDKDGGVMGQEQLAAEMPMATLNRDTGKLDFGISRSTGGTLVVSKTMILESPEILTRRLITEINRTVVAFGVDTPIQHLRIAGGGEAAPMLVAAVRDAFPQYDVQGLPAAFDLRTKTKEVEVELANRGQALLVPLGMALKGFGINHLGFEFRKGDFAAEDAFEILKGPVTVCVFLLMLFFAGTLYYVKQNEKRVAELRQTAYDMAASSFDRAYDVSAEGFKKPVRPETTEELFDVVVRDVLDGVRKSGAGTSDMPVRSAIDVWQAVTDAVAKVEREAIADTRNNSKYSGNRFPRRSVPGQEEQYNPTNAKPRAEDRDNLELEWSITRMMIRGNRLEIRGRAINVEGLQELILALAAHKDLFKDVKMDSFEPVTGEEQTNSRGQVLDKRSKYRIVAEILDPKPPARRSPASTVTAGQ